MEKLFLKMMLAGWFMLLGAIIALAFDGHFTHGTQLLLIPFTMFGALQTMLEINDIEAENE
jgi:hypothetical protein